MLSKPKFIAVVDHDKTISKGFSEVFAMNANSSICFPKLVKKLMTDRIKFQRKSIFPLPENVVNPYLVLIGKKRLSQTSDLTDCIEYYTASHELPQESLEYIKKNLLKELTISDLKRAKEMAANSIIDGTKEYTRWIKEHGGINVLASGGWLPIIESAAEKIGNFDYIVGNIPIFEHGIFTGTIKTVNKWYEFFKICRQNGFDSVRNIYTSTVALDDSPLSIPYMQKIELPLAFNPLPKNMTKFKTAGIHIINGPDLESAKSFILEWLNDK